MGPLRSVLSAALTAVSLTLSCLALAGPAAAADDCPATTPAEAERIARAYFDAFNTGDRDALDKLLAADYRHQGAVLARQDRSLHLDRLGAVRKGFPDGRFTMEWILADGDQAVVRHVFRGTQQGEFSGVQPTGRKVAVGAFHVHRIACGKIAETWNAGDALGLLRQLGAVPGPATTPADEELKPKPAAAASSCPATTPAQNAAMARRWYDEVLNTGRFETLNEMLADDVVHHAAVFVDLNGREETGNSLRAIRTGFPDIHYTVDGVVAAGDKVLVRWTGRGTQTGPFLGIPPSGKAVDWSGMNAFRFACGRVVEGWSEANGLSIMRQIGAIR